LIATVREKPTGPTSLPKWTVAIPPAAISPKRAYRPMTLGTIAGLSAAKCSAIRDSTQSTRWGTLLVIEQHARGPSRAASRAAGTRNHEHSGESGIAAGVLRTAGPRSRA
jgi:hypothetical protein